MLDRKKLSAAMALKGYSGQQLAKEIGISARSFYRKVKSGNFGSDEIMSIVDTLDIDDLEGIFFAKKVS